jgi:type II secretory pathway component PulF
MASAQSGSMDFPRRLLFPVELLIWAGLVFTALNHFRKAADVYSGLGMKIPSLTLFFVSLATFIHRFWFVMLAPGAFVWLLILVLWLSGKLTPWWMLALESLIRFALMILLALQLIAANLPFSDCCAVIR